MDKADKTANHSMPKAAWNEPNVEWVKPKLVRLDGHQASGKTYPSIAEVNGAYGTAYGPS